MKGAKPEKKVNAQTLVEESKRGQEASVVGRLRRLTNKYAWVVGVGLILYGLLQWIFRFN
jgi:hypothetical protein